jgi:signal peptidase I
MRIGELMDDWYTLEDHNDTSRPADRPNQGLGWLKELIQLVLIVVLVRVVADTFLPRYVVDGASMEPNLHTSERVIVDRVTMLLSGPSRGDIVVLDSPESSSDLLIKRVIGLPNEQLVIRGGRVYVNGKLLQESYVSDFCTIRSCDGEWQLGPDEYFVLGDNRSHSLDSHSFGPVHRSAIKGIARVRYWPPEDVGLLSAPQY